MTSNGTGAVSVQAANEPTNGLSYVRLLFDAEQWVAARLRCLIVRNMAAAIGCILSMHLRVQRATLIRDDLMPFPPSVIPRLPRCAGGGRPQVTSRRQTPHAPLL